MVALLLVGAVLAAVHHAEVMITCNGVLGLCLFAGAVTFGTTHSDAERTGRALATVITLAMALGAAVTQARHGPAIGRYPRRACPGSVDSHRRNGINAASHERH